MLSCSYSDGSSATTVSDYCQAELHLPEQCLYLSTKHYLHIIGSFIFASHHNSSKNADHLRSEQCLPHTAGVCSWEKNNSSRIQMHSSFPYLSRIKVLFSVLNMVYIGWAILECDADGGLRVRFCSWSICMVMKSGESAGKVLTFVVIRIPS